MTDGHWLSIKHPETAPFARIRSATEWERQINIEEKIAAWLARRISIQAVSDARRTTHGKR